MQDLARRVSDLNCTKDNTISQRPKSKKLFLKRKSVNSVNQFSPIQKKKSSKGLHEEVHQENFTFGRSCEDSLQDRYNSNLLQLSHYKFKIKRRNPRLYDLGISLLSLLHPFHRDLISKESPDLPWKQLFMNYKQLLNALKSLPSAIKKGEISEKFIERTKEYYRKCDSSLLKNGEMCLFKLIGIALEMLVDNRKEDRKHLNKNRLVKGYYRKEGREYRATSPFVSCTENKNSPSQLEIEKLQQLIRDINNLREDKEKSSENYEKKNKLLLRRNSEIINPKKSTSKKSLLVEEKINSFSNRKPGLKTRRISNK